MNGLCGFHGGPASVRCNPDCEGCQDEAEAERWNGIGDPTGQAGELDGQAHDAASCGGCRLIEGEQTLLYILVFGTVAWLLIGGTAAALMIVFTGSPWSLTWLAPCFLLAVGGLRQGTHVDRAIKAHGEAA